MKPFLPKPRLWRLAAASLVALALLSGCGSAGGGAETITISGAFALYPMVIRWTEEYQAANPGVQFDVQAGGAGKGVSDMLAGAADIAMVSRELRSEETDQGAVGFAVTKDAVVPVANASNPVLDDLLAAGLTLDLGAQIWLTDAPPTWGEITGTGDASEVHVFTRGDSAGAAEVWALALGGSSQEDLHGVAVQGDPGLAEAVRQDPLGIGFNNIAFAYDAATGEPVEGVRVIPLDLNGDRQITPDEDFYATRDEITAAVSDGRYPSPPARALYLVTKGAPNGAVADFLRWVLTEGQAFVEESGYVALPEAQLQDALDSLGSSD